MAESKYLTLEEELKIGLQAIALGDSGDKEAAIEVYKQVAISPSVARVWVSFLGKDALRNSGFNMYEVEKTYGKEWLNN